MRVGGQALFNGVLMRGCGKTASAVRTETGITVTVSSTKSSKKSGKLKKMPVIRGIFALMESFAAMIKGTGAKRGKMLKKILLLLAYIACIAVFLLLETWLEGRITFSGWFTYNLFAVGMITAEILLLLILLRQIPMFKRLFMYHAAEHKTINCYEKGIALTVENVRLQSRKHLRCGSNLFANLFVMVLLFELALPPIENDILYFTIDIAATLLIFGIAYEAMRYAEKHDNKAARAIGFLGGLMQKYLTTIEPTDDMLECGIAALLGVTEK